MHTQVHLIITNLLLLLFLINYIIIILRQSSYMK